MRKALAFLVLLLSPSLAATASTRAGDADPPPPGSGALLVRTGADGELVPAPTLATDVHIQVSGLVARVEVRQRFENPGDTWLEGVYVFPLPDRAAVDGLRLEAGGRVIEGRIRERAAARRSYEKARREGRKASLVEQQRPNLFSTSVAHIGPREVVEVAITYQEDVSYKDGLFGLRFPLAVTPRYVPQGATALAALGLPPVAGAVAEPECLEPALLVGAPEPVNPVHLEVELDAGMPLGEIASRSHAVDVARLPGEAYRVVLEAGAVAADRDFVLEWEPERGSAPQAAIFTEEVGGERYALVVLVPPHGDEARSSRLSRESVFVIDTSGSMAGPSLVEAKRALLHALARLGPADRFNVIAFDSDTRKLFPASEPADAPHVARATEWVEGLGAGGGTEMLPALAAALEERGPKADVRQVVFVTDGSVANEDQLFAYLEARLGRSRLFPVGIGSAPNAHFMRKAARFGRGTYTFVQRLDEVEEAMDALLGQLESPVLSDLELDWGDATVEAWPARVPDLYRGEPLVVAARLPAGVGSLRVTGRSDGAPWEAELALSGGLDHPGVAKLWARRKIEALLDSTIEGADAEAVRAAVVALGLEHHLVSRYTSLVAVDVTPSAPPGTEAVKRRVASDAPAGLLNGAGAEVALPRTATPSSLYLALGAAALLGHALLRLLFARPRIRAAGLPIRGSGDGGRS
jgi:Ca-activated chloride channel homolog